MEKKRFKFLFTQQFLLVCYFILTTLIFYIAVKQGSEGVSIRLFGGGDDGVFYWEQAKNVARGNDWIRTSIYPLIIGNLMRITGIESVYIIRMFNYFGFVLLTMLSISLINLQFKTESIIFSSRAIYKSKTILLVGFLFYLSLQMNVNLSIYRDVWIYLFYTLSVVISIKFICYKKNKILNFMMLLLSLWLLGGFRKYSLVAFILTWAISLAYRRLRIVRKPKRLVFTGIIVFALYYTFLIDFTLPVVNMSLRSALNYRLSTLEVYSGGSQMWINLAQPNFILFIINYIYSYIGNLVGPLPWHIRGMSTLLVFFAETIPMILILKFICKKRALLTKVQKYILLHATVWISLIAVSNDNVGTATRLRPVAWLLILNVFVVVYSKNKGLRNIMERG